MMSWEGRYGSLYIVENKNHFLVIFAIFSNVMGRGVCFFQTHCKEHRSLFLVIFAIYSNAMGRWGGGVVSFRLIAEIKDHCF